MLGKVWAKAVIFASRPSSSVLTAASSRARRPAGSRGGGPRSRCFAAGAVRPELRSAAGEGVVLASSSSGELVRTTVARGAGSAVDALAACDVSNAGAGCQRRPPTTDGEVKPERNGSGLPTCPGSRGEAEVSTLQRSVPAAETGVRLRVYGPPSQVPPTWGRSPGHDCECRRRQGLGVLVNLQIRSPQAEETPHTPAAASAPGRRAKHSSRRGRPAACTRSRRAACSTRAC